MKKFLILSAFSLILSSCSTWKRFYYDMSLESTEINNKKIIMEQNLKRIPLNLNDDLAEFPFEDDNIKIVWKPDYDSFNFTLTNKSSETIKLIWDECTLIDVDNKAFKVINSQTKLRDQEKTIVNSIIPKGSAIDDLVYPVGWVEYNYKYGYSAMPIFDDKIIGSGEKIEKKANKLKKMFLNKQIKILLKLEINSQIKEYLFSFAIKNIETKDYSN